MVSWCAFQYATIPLWLKRLFTSVMFRRSREKNIFRYIIQKTFENKIYFMSITILPTSVQHLYLILVESKEGDKLPGTGVMDVL